MTRFVQAGFDDDCEIEIPVYISYDYKAKSASYMAEKRADESASWAGGF